MTHTSSSRRPASEQTASTLVVDRLAARCDSSAGELRRSLAAVVDLDLLDELFPPSAAGDDPPAGSVVFWYADHEIAVSRGPAVSVVECATAAAPVRSPPEPAESESTGD